MKGVPNDYTGMRFGQWTVVERAGARNRHALWSCMCDCGRRTIVDGNSLRKGASMSCGCRKGITHGKRNTRLYAVWASMKARCFCKTNSDYKHYGARGITVCNEWKNDFQSFYDWAMANGYDENAPCGQFTIDRIDNDGNYEPTNCRWITIQDQQKNKRVQNGYSVARYTK